MMRLAAETCEADIPALLVVMGGLALITLLICAATITYVLIDHSRNR